MSEKGDVAEENDLSKVVDSNVEEQAQIAVTIDDANKKGHEPAVNSYIQEWNTYFMQYENKNQLLNSLRSRAFKESLRSCVFRSICWRVFLGCLPTSVKLWQDALSKTRAQYQVVKEKHFTNPHEEAQGKDLQLENPLSQNDHSCWSQYFKDNELKHMIDRDVKRTWPEMDFFHSQEIQDLMASVLFCYAKEHESLSYRQGMHELLAPLLFVLHCDLQGAAHAKEIGNLPKAICGILDEAYLEHDVYCMFCQVMDATNPWYSVTGKKSDEDDDVKKPSMRTVPFQSTDSATYSPPLAITNKLNRIHSNLLANYDVELFHHMNRLEIIPQVYGLRWVRLLFGREFDLQDLLVLWDALFADSKSLDLVDYIFVAMMYNIREQLLSGDYCQCMQLLMKYPPIEDIYDLVHLAMFYRNPKHHKKPTKMRRKSSGDSQSTTQTSVSNPTKKFLPKFKIDNPFSNFSLNLKKSFKSSPPRNKRAVTGAPPPSEVSVRYISPPREVEEQTPISPSKIEQRLRSMSGLDSMKVKKTEEDILKNQIEALKRQIDNLHEKCHFCSDKIEASIRLLQSHLVKQSQPEIPPTAAASPENGDGGITPIKNEEQLVALANLKQVRDMLRGTLSYMEKKPTSYSFDRMEESSQPQPSSIPNDWTMLERPHAVHN